MSDPWGQVLAARHGRSTIVEPAVNKVGTEDDIRRKVAAELSQRASAITAICGFANQPERAADFVASDKSLSDVLTIFARERDHRTPQRKGEDVVDYHARRRRVI